MAANKPRKRAAEVDVNVDPETWRAFGRLAKVGGRSPTALIADLICGFVAGDNLAHLVPKNDTARARFDRALALHKEKLELEFRERVRAERLRRDQIWLREELEEFVKAEKRNRRYVGPITTSQYRDLLRCLHPDTIDGIAASGSVDEATRRRFNACLALLTELKDILVEEKLGTPAPDLAELDRRRAEIRERNAARSKRSAATRRARSGVPA